MTNNKDTENNKQNYKTLHIDVEYYQKFFDDTDISDAEKREFIETLWTIIVQFVDMGFGIEATQLATKSLPVSSDNPGLPQEKWRAFFSPFSHFQLIGDW